MFHGCKHVRDAWFRSAYIVLPMHVYAFEILVHVATFAISFIIVGYINFNGIS